MEKSHHESLKKLTFHIWKSVNKTLLSFFFSVFFTLVCSAQSDPISRLIKEIKSEPNVDRRIDLINRLFMSADVNPVLDMQVAQLLLAESQENGDKFGEALALSQIGYDYRAFGNNIKSLEYFLKGVAVAEKTANLKLIGYTKLNLAHHYKDLRDFLKALVYYNSAKENSHTIKDPLLELWVYSSLGHVYGEMNKLDSALMYSQRSYELRNVDSTFLAPVLRQLAVIHGKFNNHELAISYFGLALKEATRISSARWMNEIHTSMAEYYKKINLLDSSKSHARSAINVVANTAFSTKIITPAKLLLDIYENTNSDSAIRYFKMYKAANDSLFSSRSIQQTQLLNLDEEFRQKEQATEKAKREEERIANTQYAAIAAALIFFIIVFLLLSRSIIVNEKLISFLGILVLLIIFEFINLLFHPYIASVTNHSPVLMLIILVGIAALLIPAHHKLEHWIKHKMVEKNKRIRLAAAKRTIEKLEK